MWFSKGLAIVMGLVACLGGASARQAEPKAGAEPCATAIYLSAKIAADRYDFDRAAQLFRACYRRDGGNELLLSQAFLYAVTAGEVEDSADLAGRLTGTSPEARAARQTMVAIAAKHGDYAQIRREVAASAGGKFDTLTFSLIDAWGAAGQKDRASVEAVLNTLRKQEGVELIAEFNAALFAEYFGDADAAEAAYRKVLGAVGLTPRLIDGYGRFLERNGKGDKAKILYDSAKGQSAYRPVALAGLARLEAGRKPEALVPGPVEGIAESLFGIASALNKRSSADAAIFYLRLVLYLRPDFDQAKLLLADRFFSIGKPELAVKVYERIDPASPYYPLAALLRVEAVAQTGKVEQAIQAAKDLTESYPEEVDAWRTYGDALRRLDRHGEAVKAYSRAIALTGRPSKSDWRLFFARAAAAFEAEDWPRAEQDLKTALELSPDEPVVLNFLGYSWVDKGLHLTEAMGMLQKAAKLSPDSGFIADSVGWAYFRLGRYPEAVEALELAVSLTPGDPTINDHLGDAYWRVGRKREAGFQWNHALTFGAEGDERAKIERKLKDGLADAE